MSCLDTLSAGNLQDSGVRKTAVAEVNLMSSTFGFCVSFVERQHQRRLLRGCLHHTYMLIIVSLGGGRGQKSTYRRGL